MASARMQDGGSSALSLCLILPSFHTRHPALSDTLCSCEFLQVTESRRGSQRERLRGFLSSPSGPT